MTGQSGIERQLRRSGILIGVGMLVELASLLWIHPTAFILFVVIGMLSMVAGVVYYLLSLVNVKESS